LRLPNSASPKAGCPGSVAIVNSLGFNLSKAEGGTDMDVDEKSNGLQDDDDRADDEAGAETTMTIPLIPFLETQDRLCKLH